VAIGGNGSYKSLLFLTTYFLTAENLTGKCRMSECYLSVLGGNGFSEIGWGFFIFFFS